MNKRLLAWPLMAAAALWTGCSNDEASAGTDGGVRLVLAAEVAADDAAVSRTAIVDGAWTWSEGDRIGLFVENAQRPTQNVPAVFREVDGKVRFEARVNAAAAGDKVYAYYPYSEQAELGADGSVTLTLPDVQSQATAGVPDGSVMPMVAQPIEIPAEGGMGVLRFKPRMSMACFEIWSSDAGLRVEKVLSVTFDSWTGIAGDYSVSYKDPMKTLRTETLDGVTTSTELGDETPVGASKAAATRVYMVLPALKMEGMNVRVATDLADYTFAADDDATAAFTANSVKSFSIDLAKADTRTEKLVSVPFTTDVLHYGNRYEGEGHQYGTILGADDLFGYQVTLTDDKVVKYWVYCGEWSELQNYVSSAKDSELLELVKTKGTPMTESGIVEILVREGGPAVVTSGVAVAVEYADGTQKVFRTHRMGAMRGECRVLSIWPEA